MESIVLSIKQTADPLCKLKLAGGFPAKIEV